MLKVLITGATGFIGSHTAIQLAQMGADVYATTHLSPAWRFNILDRKNKVKQIKADLLNNEGLSTIINNIKPDIVINFAAYGVDPKKNDSELIFKVNVTAPLNLLQFSAANNVKRFIQIGSCFEYGNQNRRLSEIDVVAPTTAYGATKAAATILLQQRAAELEIEFCVLRVFGTWGDLENSYRLVPQILTACKKSQPLSLSGCTQIRDYTYVKDVAKKIIYFCYLDNFPNGEIINLASGQVVSLKDFVISIAKLFGKENLMQFGKLPYRKNEMWRLEANTMKQQKYLKNFSYTPLETAIDSMLAAGNANEH